jgi:hypothetical protein
MKGQKMGVCNYNFRTLREIQTSTLKKSKHPNSQFSSFVRMVAKVVGVHALTQNKIGTQNPY